MGENGSHFTSVSFVFYFLWWINVDRDISGLGREACICKANIESTMRYLRTVLEVRRYARGAAAHLRTFVAYGLPKEHERDCGELVKYVEQK